MKIRIREERKRRRKNKIQKSVHPRKKTRNFPLKVTLCYIRFQLFKYFFEERWNTAPKITIALGF